MSLSSEALKGDNETSPGLHIQANNFIILSAKYFIFKKKCLNELPTANNFISYLKKQIEIEKIIALNKDKLAIHEAKWRSFNQ